MHKSIDIIGDGIENPYNAKTMIDAAKMFGSSCLFRDRKGLIESVGDMNLQLISNEQICQTYSPIIALENIDAAEDVYGFKLPSGIHPVLVAGNEKFGIARDVMQSATHVIQIPMPGKNLNTINVAAASGVALYYLNTGTNGKLLIRSHPERRRPDVLFMGAGDHNELGSAIRSAAAFGWDRLFLEDRQNIWFGCDRITRSEGRGAARRGRNSIRVVPAKDKSRYGFRQVTIVSSKHGIPLSKSNLALGPQQLIVIPDESEVDFDYEDWERLGANIELVQIKVPSADYAYHYRLFASIALAEAARQVGQRPFARTQRPIRQGPVYEKSLAIQLEETGLEIYLEDLQEY